MAQQSSPAREWHSARVATHSAVLHAVYGGPRRGMPCPGPLRVHGLGGETLLGRGRGFQEFLLF